MIKIIAIGGGEIGRPGYPIETTNIDKEIIKLSGKKKPKVLFIPTASSDSKGYCDVFTKHFGTRLGCKVNILYLVNNRPSHKLICEAILNADIIYVGGGNTLKMMNIWRKLGLDEILFKAAERGIILSGLSAGSICWFKYGNSDSRKFKNKNAGLIKVSGLGMINALNCPHYDFEPERKADLKKMMQKTPGVALALDNCCALEVVDSKYKIISSKPIANAYKVYWKSGEYKKELIKKERYFKPLNLLLDK